MFQILSVGCQQFFYENFFIASKFDFPGRSEVILNFHTQFPQNAIHTPPPPLTMRLTFIIISKYITP